MKLEQFHQTNIRTAKSIFTKKGELHATLLALTNNKMIVCGKHFENDDEKQAVYNMYAIIMLVNKVSMYTFFSEMWFSQERMPGPYLLPSQQSDRKEGIFIITRDKQNALFKNLEIVRTTDTVKLVNSEFDGHGVSDSVNLFDRINTSTATEKELRQYKAEFDALPKPDWYSEFYIEETNENH